MSFIKPRDEKEADKAGMVHPIRVGPGGAGMNKGEAYLGNGSRVKGTLNFSGPVEIDGYIEGEIAAQDKLTIGESAVVKAKVVGSEITVHGTVEGDIIASKRLILKKPAKIQGNISSAALSMEEGVVFIGSCSMNDSGSTPKPQVVSSVQR